MRSFILIIFILSSIFLSAQERSFYKIPDSVYQKHPLSLSQYLYQNHELNEEPNQSRNPLPEKYDLRTLNLVSAVKNKEQCGCCWTFATMACIESNWLKTGLGEYDLSEQHLRTCNGFYTGNTGACTGGNIQKSIAYLTRGSGPVSEKDDPYTPNPWVSCSVAEPIAIIPEGIVLPKQTDLIKQALIDNGALFTGMYYADAYYSKATNSYYYNGNQEPNHAVSLVGWDDKLTLNGKTGYWIIKNDFGSVWGENGFFYVSYLDKVILYETGYFSSYFSHNQTDKVYFYDSLGYTSMLGYGLETAYGLVKFTSESYKPVTKIGTYLNTNGGSLEAWLYQYFDGKNLSGMIGHISPKTFTNTGYFLFELDNAVAIEKGRQFYIKVKFNTPGNNFPIPIENKVEGYAYPHIETGVGWTSYNGTSWESVGADHADEINQFDLCIKAYTVDKIFTNDKESKSSLNVYPNPGTSNLTIESSSILNGTLYLFSCTGTCILKLEVSDKNNVNINTSEFNNGIYLLRFETNNEKNVTFSEKIVIGFR